jgi:hypothetical protein
VYKVTTEFLVSGDVADLTPTHVAEIKEAAAALIPGAHASDMTVTLLSASVRVLIEYKSSSRAAADAAKMALTEKLSSGAAAAAAFAVAGITVTSKPSVSAIVPQTVNVVDSPPLASEPLSSSEQEAADWMKTWLPVAILAMTSVLSCLACCSYLWCLLRRKNAIQVAKVRKEDDGSRKHAARGRLSLSKAGDVSVAKSVDMLRPMSAQVGMKTQEAQDKEKEWTANYGETGPKVIHHSLWRADK